MMRGSAPASTSDASGFPSPSSGQSNCEGSGDGAGEGLRALGAVVGPNEGVAVKTVGSNEGRGIGSRLGSDEGEGVGAGAGWRVGK